MFITLLALNGVAAPLDLSTLKKIEIAYTIDMQGCAATYTGDGKTAAAASDVVTFKGTWTSEPGS